VVEEIGYGVPQYKIERKRVGLSVAKAHVTIGFDYGLISDFIRKELERKKYKLGLQTLQINFNQDVPITELQKILNTIKTIQ